MEVKYSAAVFHAILAGLQDDRLAQQEFDLRDDGVWLKPFRPDKPWHPWDEMLERGSPNPDEKPLLSLPWFTARELAAFLVDGGSPQRWFKPAKGQFQIYYKLGSAQPEYVPDFVAGQRGGKAWGHSEIRGTLRPKALVEHPLSTLSSATAACAVV